MRICGAVSIGGLFCDREPGHTGWRQHFDTNGTTAWEADRG